MTRDEFIKRNCPVYYPKVSRIELDALIVEETGKLVQIIEMLTNVINWWMDRYPDLVEECDYDALKEAREAVERAIKK